jgi:RNA polymerase I-specific transcription initiation factor RRN7
VEIYPVVKRLRNLSGFSFSYPTSKIGKRKAIHLPELQIMILVVISTKVLFPLDDLKRYPVSSREPAAQLMDWKRWVQIQRHFDGRETSGGKIGKGNEIVVTERDVFNMTESQLDEYMDWYENSWLDSSRGKGEPQLLY